MFNNELIMDTDYAPKFSNRNMGDNKEVIKYIIVSIPTFDKNDLNYMLFEDTEEAREDISKMEGIDIVAEGTGYNTNLAKLTYGLNHIARTMFRSGVNNIVEAFTSGDDSIKGLLLSTPDKTDNVEEKDDGSWD
jgi:hypothetical protein